MGATNQGQDELSTRPPALGGDGARIVLWRRFDVFGAERCVFSRRPDGWSLEGSGVLSEPLLDFQYQVRCDPSWRTRSASVQIRWGQQARSLALSADGQGRWHLDGRELEGLRGCLDVDLSFTPSTNTLPIRRAPLAVGARAELSAAWVRVPELTVEPLAQRYTRLELQRFRYESGSFAADLDVDDWGVVVRYAGLWEQVARE